jgi:hypothetical protein
MAHVCRLIVLGFDRTYGEAYEDFNLGHLCTGAYSSRETIPLGLCLSINHLGGPRMPICLDSKYYQLNT